MRECLKIISILMLPFLVSACSSSAMLGGLLVGGAAAGYYIGKDPRAVAQISEDLSTTATIKGWYIGDKDVSAVNINVDTYRGVVTLYGSVETREAETLAMNIAAKAKGVIKVISKLTVIAE